MVNSQRPAIRVLLVDDSQDHAEAIRQTFSLTKTPLDVIQKKTLDDALRLLQTESADIILLNLHLPDSTGCAAYERARAAAPEVPIVVLPAEGHPDLVRECLSQRTDGTHDKSALRDLLAAVLQNTLAKEKTERELASSMRHIKHLNRILRAIRNVNQLITREKDPEVFVKRSCELLVETRGYRGVCVIVNEHEDIPSILGSAGWNGEFEDFRQQFAAGWRPPCALRSTEDGDDSFHLTPTFCAPCPLHRDEESEHVLARLQHGHHDFGVLSVALASDVRADAEDATLVREIAGDLALALYSLHAAAIAEATEDRHRQLFESMLLGVIYQGEDGVITDANPAAERILGLTRDQLLGRTSMDPRWRAIHEDGTDFPGDEHPIMLSLSTGEVIRNVLMGIYSPARDGTRWIRITSVPEFRPGEDKPYRAFVTFEDVTERRARLEELRRTEQLLQETGQLAQVGGWEVDLESNTVIWSETTRTIHEVDDDYVPTLEQAIGFFPDVQDELREALRRAQEDGIPYDMILPFVTAKGRKLWTRTICMPELRDGTCVRLHGVFQDVTKEKEILDALRASEDRFRTITESSADAIFITDQHGRYQYVNAAACQLLGYESSDLIGRTIEDISAPSERAKSREDFAELLATGRLAKEMDLQRKDGSIVPVDLNAVVLPDGSVYGSCRDISEKLEIEARLRQSQKLESIGTLASGVAHEINNPLMGILNYAELLKDEPSDEERRSFIDGIIKEGERVSSIVANLLSFARREKETGSLAIMHDLVEGALSLTGSILRKDGIRIELDLPDDLPPVLCRSQQIQQVLINLLTNARDALNKRYAGFDDGKLLRIIVRSIENKAGSRWLRTTIEDYGTGIAEDVVPRIFDPFFTTKPRDEGTGLGLSVSYGIVKKHDGDLWVESQVGSHTRFHMDLPLGN